MSPLPVARMSATPVPHPLHFLRPTPVIAVGRALGPDLLLGCFAGLLACGLGTEALVVKYPKKTDQENGTLSDDQPCTPFRRPMAKYPGSSAHHSRPPQRCCTPAVASSRPMPLSRSPTSCARRVLRGQPPVSTARFQVFVTRTVG